MFIPTVIENSNKGDRGFDLYSRLLRSRIIFLGEPIDDHMANIIVAELLYLESESHDDISIYINSPGGSVSSGLAILDTMEYIQSPVSTICVGQAASMAAVLLCAGEKGKRYMLSNARSMIHQVMGGMSGQATDIQIQAREIQKYKDKLNQLISKYTGQPLEKVVADCERDTYMSSEESVAYGLVDSVYKKEQASSNEATNK